MADRLDEARTLASSPRLAGAGEYARASLAVQLATLDALARIEALLTPAPDAAPASEADPTPTPEPAAAPAPTRRKR